MIKLSICIPTYNRPDFLYRAVASVISSKTDDIEILVFDNSESSDSEEIINSFHDPRIVYKRHKSNVGMLGNWNALLYTANGEYIKFLNDDDWFDFGAIDMFLEHLDVYKGAIIYNYRAKYRNKFDQVVKMDSKIKSGNVRLSGIDAARKVYFGSNKFGVPSQSMFRREESLLSGGFGQEMSYALDVRLMAKMLYYGDVVFLDDVPVNILSHPQQANKFFTVGQKIKDQQEYYNILFDTFGSENPAKDRSAVNSFIAWHEAALNFKSGNLISAIKALNISRYKISGLKEFIRRDIIGGIS